LKLGNIFISVIIVEQKIRVQTKTFFSPYNTYGFFSALVAATAILFKSYLGNKKTQGCQSPAVNRSMITIED